MNEDSKKLVQVEVEGKNPELWQRLKSKLMVAIEKLLDTEANSDTGTTYRDELKEYKNLAINFGKEKLKRPSIENEKIVAEIDLLYSQRQKTLAEARKTNAEAASIETSTTIKKLKIMLLTMKMLVNENKDEILFIKEAENLLEIVSSINNSADEK